MVLSINQVSPLSINQVSPAARVHLLPMGFPEFIHETHILPTPVFLPGESQGWRSLGGLPSMGSHRVGHD